MKRTNIEIDEKLAEKSMAISGLKTYKDVVNLALSDFVKKNNRKNLLKYMGSEIWEGNLEDTRSLR